MINRLVSDTVVVVVFLLTSFYSQTNIYRDRHPSSPVNNNNNIITNSDNNIIEE